MDRFVGYVASEADSIPARAATALIWLYGKNKGHADRAFASWTELYCATTATPIGDVDPAEVQRRLRRNGYLMKTMMRDIGWGTMSHPSDRTLLRACPAGRDATVNTLDGRDRRFRNHADEHRVWIAKLGGDLAALESDPEIGPLARRLRSYAPLLRTIGESPSRRAA